MDNNDFHNALYKEYCLRETIEMKNRQLQYQNQKLKEMLEYCVNEFKGLPHSLGYEFTHIPNIEKLLTEK